MFVTVTSPLKPDVQSLLVLEIDGRQRRVLLVEPLTVVPPTRCAATRCAATLFRHTRAAGAPCWRCRSPFQILLKLPPVHPTPDVLVEWVKVPGCPASRPHGQSRCPLVRAKSSSARCIGKSEHLASMSFTPIIGVTPICRQLNV